MSGKSKRAFDRKAYHTRRQNAESLRHQGLYSKAADLFRQNLAISSKYFRHDHANVLNDRDGLSGCLHDLGQYQAAAAIDEETLWHRHHLDKEAKETTKTRVNLAQNLTQLGQFGKAIVLYQSVLSTRKITLGNTHPDTLDTRHWLAWSLHRHGNVDEAFRHNVYLLDILSESLRAEDYDMIQCKHNLATNWCAFGDYGQAMQLTVENLQALRKTRPSSDSQLRTVKDLQKHIDQCLTRARGMEPEVRAFARKGFKEVLPKHFHRPRTRDRGDETKKAALHNKSFNMYDARDGS